MGPDPFQLQVNIDMLSAYTNNTHNGAVVACAGDAQVRLGPFGARETRVRFLVVGHISPLYLFFSSMGFLANDE